MNFLTYIDRKILIVIVVVMTIVVCLDRFFFYEKAQSIPLESNKNILLAPSAVQSADTSSQSKTAWGMSPFGGGEPIKEEVKPKFKKPNLEWRSKSVNGLAYIFGEGNPKEVALTDEQIKDLFSRNEITTYMTKDAEHYMFNLLSSGELIRLKEICGNYVEMPRSMDLEDVVIIGSNGRKEFNEEFMSQFENMISYFSDYSIDRPCMPVSEFNSTMKPIMEMYLGAMARYRVSDIYFVQQRDAT